MPNVRSLGTAIVLWSLLDQSGQFDTWANMERLLQAFVGWTDSLTFGPLGGLLAGAGIRTLADVPDLATLERLQQEMVAGQLGVQNIRSDWFAQPFEGRYALPQTFTVFGQKFVPDSWAFSQTVFSSILRVENGQTNKVPRRVPGALDVAFSVLGNDQVVPDLVGRIQKTILDINRPHAMAFRDGLPYQHNLAAVRAVMDQQIDDAWTTSFGGGENAGLSLGCPHEHPLTDNPDRQTRDDPPWLARVSGHRLFEHHEHHPRPIVGLATSAVDSTRKSG